MKALIRTFLIVVALTTISFSSNAQIGNTTVTWHGSLEDLLPPCLIPDLIFSGNGGGPLPIIWGQSSTHPVINQSIYVMTGPNTSPYTWITIPEGGSGQMEFCCNGTKLFISFVYTYQYSGAPPFQVLTGANLDITVNHSRFIPCDE